MGELYLNLRTGEVRGNFPVGLNVPAALKLLREAVMRLEEELHECIDCHEYADYDEGKISAA